MSLTGKKILVTGAGGFLGEHVVARLKAVGISEDNIVAHSRNSGNLLDPSECEKVAQGSQIVIHLAGITGGISFHHDNAARIYEENRAMGMNVIVAAQKSGAEKFVMAGSLTEYGVSAPLPLREDTLWDGEPKPMHAPYARAKRALLVEATKRRAKGLQSAHLLLASMYGPGEKDDFVIPALIRRMTEAKEKQLPSVPVMGTGNDTRDFLYVDDAAEAIVLAAEKYDSDIPVNIASGKETTIRDLALTIARLVGYGGKVEFDNQPESAERVAADITRAKEWGWSPATSLEKGLLKTIEWHRMNS